MGMKVALDFDRVEGNADALLDAFRRAARQQGYPQADIDRVIAEARSGDYGHLVDVLMRNTI